jgi:hypothetical protein
LGARCGGGEEFARSSWLGPGSSSCS